MQSARISAVFRQDARVRAVALAGLLLGLGVLFSLAHVSLVRAATASIDVPQISAAVPETDPFSPLWNGAQAATIPLSAQQMYQPGGGSVQGVQVKAISDGKRIAFLVSWDDATRNDYVKDTPSDAAAIELPIDPTNLPYQCMGQSTSLVNIWQWKAAIEATAKQAGVPDNGTRNLTSDGMGKAADAPGVPPTATSTWRDGHWYLIFARDLAEADTGSAPLTVGLATNAAFAVWDGAKGETRSMKAVSTWVPVTIEAPGGPGVSNYLWLAGTVIIAIVLTVLAWRLIPH